MRRTKATNWTAALGLSEPDDVPIESEQRRTEPDFFERLLQLAPEDWQNDHTVYCYLELITSLTVRRTKQSLCR
jgi:hypothetical protein